MKNIFKLMGVALIAGSMLFVACNKDENDDQNNNNNNNNNQPATPTAKVTFGSTSWDANIAEIYTQNYQNFGVVEYMLQKEAQNYPMIDMIISAKPGTYSHEATVGTQFEGTDSAYNYYAFQTQGNPYYDIYSISYFEKAAVQLQSGYNGDWEVKSAELTVSAFDLNALTATYKLTATMYDFYSWYYMQVNDATDTETKNLTVDVNNFKFTVGESK